MHDLRSSIRSGTQRPSTPVARKAKPKRDGEGLGGLTRIAIKREEARITNQRCEDRHFNVIDECVISFRRRKHEVRVINVSSRGAMLEAEIEPRIGENLEIRFSEQAKTRCVVRWIRGRRIGVEFVNETIFWDSTPSAAGPVFHAEEEGRPEPSRPREIVDRDPRQTLLRKGTLYWSGISVPVRLRNISANGAKVESERELVPGSEVELDLGEAGFQMAEVRWAKDGQVGLRFAEAFDLDSLAPSEAAAAGSPADMLKPAYLETELRPDSPWAARFERLSMTDLRPLDEDG